MRIALYRSMEKMKKVLVIDDESDLCALLKIIFKRENFHVNYATNLADAKSKLLLHHHDIVLLDYNLPDGLGLDYYHEHPEAFHDSYIVLMSADSNPVLSVQAKKEGINEFIQKPFTIKTMREIIRKAG
jgi:two-component system, OmpR family, response regulator